MVRGPPAARLAAAIEMSHDRNVSMTIVDSAGRGLIWPGRPGSTKRADQRRQRELNPDHDPKL